MTNNLHPLFVHFPIALFTMYALLECIPSKTLRNNRVFFLIKFAFLFIGFISAWPTLMTGDEIEHMFSGDAEKSAIISLHSMWASVSVTIFGILAVAYFMEWIKKYEEVILQHQSIVAKAYCEARGAFTRPGFINRLWCLIIHLQETIFNKHVLILLAILGLLALTITGALGAVLVHGAGVDPIVNFFYELHKPLMQSPYLNLIDN